jgi:uncharacterized protein YndB with AHSA1/START domain
MGYIREMEISASPHRVWTGLSSPDDIVRWLAPRANVRLEPGGPFELFWNQNSSSGSRVRAVSPGQRIEVDWELDGKFHQDSVSTVRISVRDDRGGTVVSVEDLSQHRAVYDEEVADAWEQALVNLKEWLEDGTPATCWPDLG